MVKLLAGPFTAVMMFSAAYGQDLTYPNDHLIVSASELDQLVQAEGKGISSAQASLIVVDVRSAQAFAEGHIIGARKKRR